MHECISFVKVVYNALEGKVELKITSPLLLLLYHIMKNLQSGVQMHFHVQLKDKYV